MFLWNHNLVGKIRKRHRQKFKYQEIKIIIQDNKADIKRLYMITK